MRCYKDMWFCPFYTDCQLADSCPRALTPTVKQDARAKGCLISEVTDKPECWTKLKPIKKGTDQWAG